MNANPVAPLGMRQGEHARVVRVVADEHPTSPREYDNLGIIACVPTRYALGDETIETLDDTAFAVERDAAVLLPVHLLDHSGLAISLTPFHCPWDSGQVGWIYATRPTIREAFGVERITSSVRIRVVEVLAAEIAEYDAYLRGEGYGYEIVEDGVVVDSCWGYYSPEAALAAGETA